MESFFLKTLKHNLRIPQLKDIQIIAGYEGNNLTPDIQSMDLQTANTNPLQYFLPDLC